VKHQLNPHHSITSPPRGNRPTSVTQELTASDTEPFPHLYPPVIHHPGVLRSVRSRQEGSRPHVLHGFLNFPHDLGRGAGGETSKLRQILHGSLQHLHLLTAQLAGDDQHNRDIP